MVPPELEDRIALLVAAAATHEQRGDVPAARRAATAAVELGHASADPRIRAEALRSLGALEQRGGAFGAAEQRYRQAHDLDTARQDHAATATDLAGQALAILDSGRPLPSREAFERARDLHMAAGDEAGLGATLRGLARWYRLCQDPALALIHARSAVELARRAPSAGELARSLCEVGHCRLATGEPATAELDEARQLARACGAVPGSIVDDTVLMLDLAQEAVESGQAERCLCGEMIEVIPSGLRRWLRRSGRFTGPPADGEDDPVGQHAVGFGPYRVEEVLGHGGGGVVYRAAHTTSGEVVAVKAVVLEDRRRRLLLRREVRALARLAHSGIVRIVEEHIDDHTPWYAMELVDGTPLTEHVAAHWDPCRIRTTELDPTADDVSAARGGGPTTDEGSGAAPPIPHAALVEILTVTCRICETLAYLHGEGIVHRDLKPDNIIVRADGLPVIVDFGLASQGGRERLEDAMVRGGTVLYVAPEQVRGEVVDARADLYALGAVLYHLLTGRPPFISRHAAVIVHQHLESTPRPPSELVAALPPELDRLVLRLLAKAPSQRLGYAEDVAVVLRRFGARSPEVAAPRAKTYLYQPELAGRDALANRLRAAVDTHGQHGGFIAIGGESGMGKTRLALEAVRRAMDRQTAVVTGTCPERGTALAAFRAVFQAVADRCREGGDGLSARLLGQRGPVLAAYSSAVASLPSVESTAAPAELPADAARIRTITYTADTLVALAAEEPVLLLLDDVQWVDELSLGVLSFVVRWRLPRARLLVVATYRTEEATPALLELVQSRAATWLTLEPLDEAAIGRMVASMLAREPPPTRFAHHLYLRSEGNPFFVAEYLRAAVSEGLLWRDPGGTWQIAGADGAEATAEDYERLPLPGALRGIVERRLANLEPDDHRLAETLAVLGGESSIELLMAAAQAPLGDVLTSLSVLLERHVLTEKEGARIGFGHDQIRQALYEDAAPARRAELHRAAATAIEELGMDELQQDLGRHHELGRQPEQALRAYRESAQRARLRHAHDEAERHLRAALRLAPADSTTAIELRISLADVLDVVGRPSQAHAELMAARAAARRCGSSSLANKALRHAAVIDHQSGRLAAARAGLDEALAGARELGDPHQLADVLRSLANLLIHQQERQAAEELYDEALRINQRIGNRHGEAVVLGAIGVAHFVVGELDEARSLLEKAVAIKRELGDLRGAALTLGNLGALHARQGRLDEARAAYETALSFKRQTGDRRGEAVVLGNFAALLHDGGSVEESLRLFERCRDIHRELDTPWVEGIMTANIGSAMLLLGRHAEAEAAFSTALAIHRGVGNRRSEAIALTLLGDVLHLQGRLDEARLRLIEGCDLQRALGNRRDLGTSLRAMADLARDTGDVASAARFIDEAVALLREAKDRLELALALCSRGHVALAQQRDANVEIDEAATIAVELHLQETARLGRHVDRLRRAQQLHDSGDFTNLWRGQSRADVPPAVLAASP